VILKMPEPLRWRSEVSEIDTFMWIIGSILAIAFIVFIIIVAKPGSKEKREEAKKLNSKEK